MKLVKQPLWQQLFSPTSLDELTELRVTLSHNPHFAEQLEAYLHAQSLVFSQKARVELNPALKSEYQHSANILVDLLGQLLRPEKLMTTERQLKV